MCRIPGKGVKEENTGTTTFFGQSAVVFESRLKTRSLGLLCLYPRSHLILSVEIFQLCVERWRIDNYDVVPAVVKVTPQCLYVLGAGMLATLCDSDIVAL